MIKVAGDLTRKSSRNILDPEAHYEAFREKYPTAKMIDLKWIDTNDAFIGYLLRIEV